MLRACLLAIIAGYADTIGFLRYDAFAGLMTGNTILLGIELARLKFADAAFHGAIIAIFLSGVCAARLLLRFGWAVPAVLSLTSLLLALCSILPGLVPALVLPLAMGLQNSAANRFNGIALNTVFITGNLQKLGEELIAWLWPHPKQPRSSTGGVAIFGLVWVGYLVGAVLGAAANAAISWPLLIPAVILPAVMLEESVMEKLRRVSLRQ